MKYYLIAGEASGDLHASNLMKALLEEDPAADFRFFGGEKMAAVGGTLVRHYRDLAYMGFIAVAMHLRTILRGMRQCKQDIARWQPDVVILVDYPGFNLSIAKFVKRHTQIPVFYYISPKIWAWKERRIKAIRQNVDELFSILPFEKDFYEGKHHYPIHYVGNPCVDAVAAWAEKRTETPTETPQSRPAIALVPGSRKAEISSNLRLMALAAKQFPDHKTVIAGAPNLPESLYREHLPEGFGAEIVFGKTYDIVASADAALVTSGTATLETALLRTPQAVCYHTRCGRFVRFMQPHFLKVPYISLVNLIAGREVVPELIGDAMNADRCAAELRAILPGGNGRDAMLQGYDEVINRLGPAGASNRAAKEMVATLRKRNAAKS